MVNFVGNTNLIYSIIRSKSVFYQLANLSEDSYQLVKPPSGNVTDPNDKEEGTSEDVNAAGGGKKNLPVKM